MDRRRFLREAGKAGALAVTAGASLRSLTGSWVETAAAAGVPAAAGVYHAPADLAAKLAGLVKELEKDFPYAYALYTREESTTLEASEEGRKVNSNGPTEGIVVGIWDGDAYREEATSLVSADGIAHLRERLKNVPLPISKGDAPDPGPALVKNWNEAGKIAIDSQSLAERLDSLATLQASIKKQYPALTRVRMNSMTGRSERLFVNRTRTLHQALSRAGIDGFALARKEGSTPGALGIRIRGIGGLELADMPPETIARWIERTQRLVGAPAPDPGTRIVVCEPNVAGVVAHESFGHGVEVDMFMTGRARAADYLGKPVASEMVTMMDDPTQAGGWGSYHFDDEGWGATPTTIIENGIFKRGLTDSWSAHRTNQPRSANGRREAWDHKPYARMSNTFFARGKQTREELISGVNDGLLVGHFTAGIEDPKGWGMQVVCQYGEIIKNGKLTGQVVSPVSLTGYVPDVLGSIDGIGNDFELGPGTCGKGYKEFIPVSSGGPTVRFRCRVS